VKSTFHTKVIVDVYGLSYQINRASAKRRYDDHDIANNHHDATKTGVHQLCIRSFEFHVKLRRPTRRWHANKINHRTIEDLRSDQNFHRVVTQDCSNHGASNSAPQTTRHVGFRQSKCTSTNDRFKNILERRRFDQSRATAIKQKVRTHQKDMPPSLLRL
jgi:hypothetical protein